MSVQASNSATSAVSNPTIEALKMHLVKHMEKGPAAEIGTLELLQGVVKISNNVNISTSISVGYYEYPLLPKRQYLVACVHNSLDVRVWGIYTEDQIRAMEVRRDSGQVGRFDWQILEIPEKLEVELRKGIIDLDEIGPSEEKTSSGWRCTVS